VRNSWRTGRSEGFFGTGVAFSPDGRLLATGLGARDSTVQIWDVRTGRELAAFKGHHSAIAAVAFSSDGRTLASGGGDSTVLMWDVTGRRGLASKPLAPNRLQELWDNLADGDAKKAYAATWELALSPDGAVASRASGWRR
jgi:WD40 repeat protein